MPLGWPIHVPRNLVWVVCVDSHLQAVVGEMACRYGGKRRQLREKLVVLVIVGHLLLIDHLLDLLAEVLRQ